MPFKSRAQQRWMFKNKPKMAAEWAAKTKNIKSLTARVGKKKSQPGDLYNKYKNGKKSKK